MTIPPPEVLAAACQPSCSAKMPAIRIRPKDLPATFAIFPLPGVLLLPHGRLPLNIFEPRYRAMTEDSLGAGRMFATIQPDPGAPEGPNGPALYRVGCLGRITSFSETDDGRYMITLLGLARFTIASEIDMHRGYRRVMGDFAPYLTDLADPEAGAVDREAMLAALRGYFSHKGVDANWDAIQRLPDPALVVTLAMVCPFEPIEKQALLEAPSEADRADTLLALLRMGAAEQGEPHGRPVS